MDVTLAPRKNGDTPIWWLAGFLDETWKLLSFGIQLAASSVLGVLSGCQGPWKVVVIFCANKKLFVCLRKTAITKGIH
jgi:hypothetical protein